MKKLLLIAFILSAWMFQSCETSTSGIPHSTGKTLEIIVVTNNKAQWNGSIGEAIRNTFGAEQLGLPQSEPLFSMVNLPEEAFIKMYQSNRDIFIVDISNSIEKAQIENEKDFWASPQRVIKISAPDTESFFEIFDQNKDAIIEYFYEVERERMIKAFKTAENIKVKNALIEKFNLSLVLPTAYKISKQEDNFMWIRKETLEESQGLLIYSYPYTDTSAFEKNNIVSVRNQFTQRYIPGPSDGSYMKVADEFIEPVTKELDFNGKFAVETRGLWETAGDFMGGPFLSYTLIDEVNNRVITLDSYVYAPSQNKRDLLKQLEAILYSFKFEEN